MIAMAAGVFAASVLGSPHCAGMCGPLAAVYAAGEDHGRARTAHAAYNVARLVAYALLGAAAGFVGGAVDLAGSFAGVQRAAAVVSAALIVSWGLVTLLAALGVRAPLPALVGRLPRPAARVLARLRGRSPIEKAAALGLASGFLPCGWLWAFLATAAGTGGALAGALLMAFFWLGTLPVLLAAGAAARALAGPLRRHVPALCAALVMVLGLVSVGMRALDPATLARARGTMTAPAIPETPPCHEGR